MTTTDFFNIFDLFSCLKRCLTDEGVYSNKCHRCNLNAQFSPHSDSESPKISSQYPQVTFAKYTSLKFVAILKRCVEIKNIWTKGKKTRLLKMICSEWNRIATNMVVKILWLFCCVLDLAAHSH